MQPEVARDASPWLLLVAPNWSAMLIESSKDNLFILGQVIVSYGSIKGADRTWWVVGQSPRQVDRVLLGLG